MKRASAIIVIFCQRTHGLMSAPICSVIEAWYDERRQVHRQDRRHQLPRSWQAKKTSPGCKRAGVRLLWSATKATYYGKYKTIRHIYSTICRAHISSPCCVQTKKGRFQSIKVNFMSGEVYVLTFALANLITFQDMNYAALWPMWVTDAALVMGRRATKRLLCRVVLARCNCILQVCLVPKLVIMRVVLQVRIGCGRCGHGFLGAALGAHTSGRRQIRHWRPSCWDSCIQVTIKCWVVALYVSYILLPWLESNR